MKLDLSSQERLDAIRIDASDQPPSDIWETVARTDSFQNSLVNAVRAILADSHRREWSTRLVESGVSARDGRYAQLIAWLDRPTEHDAHQDALEYTAALGQGTVTVYGDRCTLDDALDGDLVDGPLAVLAAAGVTPTIAARIDKDRFSERPRQQRENTLQLLATLATQCDVHLVCTRLTARWLAENHRTDLPIDFDERLDTGRDGTGPTESAVTDALAALDPDGGPVELLRVLADEPTQTVPQASLPSELCRDPSTVSQYLNQLEALDLVERYSVGAGNHVSLKHPGEAYLDELDAEIGRQQRLDRMFADTGHHSKRPCNHAHGREEGEGQPGQQPPTATAPPSTDSTATAPYRTRFLDRASHAATVGISTDGAITLADAPIPDYEDIEDCHTRRVSYDPDRDEAVVAIRATTALQGITSIALSLASPRLIDQALPPTRLNDLDPSPHILRSARCVGGLSSEAEDDAEVLRDNLVEWGERLAGMTTDLQHGEYEDRGQFRREIMRSAHGLAGTIAHLLDVAGVDLVREIQIPSGLGDEDLEELAEMMSVATSIQSTYGHYATYRQLFEQRDGKRQTAMVPEVDAEDPLGDLIGSFVVRSPDASRFQPVLAEQIENPAPLHEDAPEIAVHVPLREVNRSDYATVVTRICEQKNLQTTREAVTLCRALTSGPWATATALNHLSSESRPREIRLDEVRVALSHLDPDQLLPSTTPTVSKAVAGLLRSARPLSKTELAERAGVSTRSLRRAGNLDALIALDLVRETDDGSYRFTLPFSTEEERGEQVCPEPVDDGLATVRDVLYEVVLVTVDDAAMRTADPDDPLGRPFFGSSFEIKPLLSECSWLNPWVRVARVLSGTVESRVNTATFGSDIEQAPIGGRASRKPEPVAIHTGGEKG